MCVYVYIFFYLCIYLFILCIKLYKQLSDLQNHLRILHCDCLQQDPCLVPWHMANSVICIQNIWKCKNKSMVLMVWSHTSGQRMPCFGHQWIQPWGSAEALRVVSLATMLQRGTRRRAMLSRTPKAEVSPYDCRWSSDCMEEMDFGVI